MMKAWQHFKTITTHKIWVMRYCFKIGLYWQGLTHDLSKYSPTEFLVGMKYYQGDRSPNNAEREDTGMSKSWMHHKGRNKHHFEYWIDYGINCDTIIKGVPMPRRYVAEMIMDRISASRVYLGDAYTDQAPYQYLKKGIGHLWFVHPETLSQLEFLLRMLSERGEDDTLTRLTCCGHCSKCSSMESHLSSYDMIFIRAVFFNTIFTSHLNHRFVRFCTGVLIKDFIHSKSLTNLFSK